MDPLSKKQNRSRLITTLHLALYLFTAFLLTGCGSMSGVFGGQGRAGLPMADSNALSKLSLDSRAEAGYAQLEMIPRQARPILEEDNIPQPTLSLQGKALKDSSLVVDLYTNKIDYSTGYAEINNDKWQIIAFDNIGNADDVFEFIYLLTSPSGRVQYLVVNGGKFKTEDGNFVGYEGTLIKPGKRHNLESPAKIAKIDFGFDFHLPAAYITMTAEAKSLAKQIDGNTGNIQSNYMKSSKVEADLAQLRGSTPASGKEEKHQQNIIKLEDKIADLTNIIAQQAEDTQIQFEKYFKLRQKISKEFAAFTKSNQFFWSNGKQKYQDAFRKVFDYDLKVEATLKVFGAYVGDNEDLVAKQQKTNDIIARNKDYEEKL